MYTNCYNCGQEGHRRSECPSRSAFPDTAPVLTHAPSNRPEDKPIPVPVPASQRSAYGTVNPHAEQLRREMGWASPRPVIGPLTREQDHDAYLPSRIRAAEQVAESRAARSVLP